MSSVLLIANPAASQFTGGLHRTAMRTLAKRHDVTAAWPRNSAESESMAAEAVAGGTELVVAMGGDGVVHHVAQGLVDTSAVLGIIPVGTTNVLARILGAPSNPKKAVKILSKGFDAKRVPTLAVEGRSFQTEFSRSALFSLGVGPDAAVVQAAEQDPLKKRSFGSIHYARTAVNTIRRDLRKRRPTVTILAGDREVHGIGLLAQFHDVYTYFGNRPLIIGRPNPIAVLVVERLKLRKVPAILRAAGRKGSLDAIEGLTVWEDVSSFEVRSPVPVEAQADGELLAAITHMRVTYQPDSLTVAVSTAG
ncbi:MAG TPA: diacylglycerol kinase family protein [Acidimicrobiia bacterium]|jgi:diacylglycerol kinase family enzyme